ncbi:hypothetical protein [Bacillus altitudinis]|uniref:hypothetical protein n=1 Tax=Bacillus altitudinis TaxID=293387 RepID=UPI00210091B4|nr:hypothetical protein [Bacillus altitudinis]UTV34853.1 hypothetical protein NM966_19865 [Bacillus altitudinis]
MDETIVCKHCGSDEGFYTLERIYGNAMVCYNARGDILLDQHSMYDNVRHSGGKRAYCYLCHKIIGKSEDLISGEEEKDTW